MKFGHAMQNNKISFQKSCKKGGRETSSRPPSLEKLYMR